MTPVLSARNLAVGYRRAPAVLSDLNLTVEAGEVVALLGVNGIGKSTLMRTLARMQPALGGTIEINGSDIGAMSQQGLARNVAVVLTERVSVGAMSAGQLVELGRYPHTNWSGLLSEADRAIARDAIVAVGAGHLAHRDINELSDGERQRFMIARAVAQQPALLLLDEPAAFLDVSARVEMMAMLRKLAREKDVAIILSSHDLELSLRTADTIWLIDGAGKMHSGAPEDLLAAGLIGKVFSGPTVRFSAEDRSFKIVRQPVGKAHVSGESAALARAVLEREGFEIVSAPEAAAFAVAAEPSGWAWKGAESASGETYGELARFVRSQAGLASAQATGRQR